MLTQEELKQVLHYDPDTGEFTWIVGRPGIFPNTKTGYKNPLGYIEIGVNYKIYLGHRLAWLYVHGSFPKEIDHLNHDRSDNRMCNLRAVTHQQNSRNSCMSKNNTSGFNGVSYSKGKNKWLAQIMVEGRNKHLGAFDDKEDAIKARKLANIKYGFHANHGKRKAA